MEGPFARAFRPESRFMITVRVLAGCFTGRQPLVPHKHVDFTCFRYSTSTLDFLKEPGQKINMFDTFRRGLNRKMTKSPESPIPLQSSDVLGASHNSRIPVQQGDFTIFGG